MPNHSSVKAVLRHNCAAAPALFRFAPLGATILEPHLRWGKENGNKTGHQTNWRNTVERKKNIQVYDECRDGLVWRIAQSERQINNCRSTDTLGDRTTVFGMRAQIFHTTIACRTCSSRSHTFRATHSRSSASNPGHSECLIARRDYFIAFARSSIAPEDIVRCASPARNPIKNFARELITVH